MKFISILLVLCFSMNVFASSKVIEELEKQMDEYNYAITVEWDQKDQAFYDSESKIFLDRLDALYKSGELSPEVVMFMLNERVKDKKTLEAMKLKASLMNQSLSPIEMVKELNKDNLYNKGASWSGNIQETMFWAAIGLLIAANIAYALWTNANFECTKHDQAEQCVDSYSCWGDSCGYDSTSCEIITRCTKYEKKGE